MAENNNNHTPDPHVSKTIDDLLEHEDSQHVALPDFLDNIIRTIGHIVCWANGLLMITIIIQIGMRYFLSSGQTFLEELQWHFYGLAVMIGLAYAQVNDNHVRVDIFYSGFSDRKKRIVEVISILFFVFPLVFVIFYHSLDFVADSWRVSEGSDSADGLPYRFLIKSVIPISFGLLGLASLSRLIRDVYLLVKGA